MPVPDSPLVEAFVASNTDPATIYDRATFDNEAFRRAYEQLLDEFLKPESEGEVDSPQFFRFLDELDSWQAVHRSIMKAAWILGFEYARRLLTAPPARDAGDSAPAAVRQPRDDRKLIDEIDARGQLLGKLHLKLIAARAFVDPDGEAELCNKTGDVEPGEVAYDLLDECCEAIDQFFQEHHAKIDRERQPDPSAAAAETAGGAR